MNDRSQHLDWDQLNQLADGSMHADEAQAATGHLDICTECRKARADLDQLLGELSKAACDEEPPIELWSSIRASIGVAPASSVQGERSGLNASRVERGQNEIPRKVGNHRNWRMLAAAAVLMIASSAATMFIMDRGDYNGTSQLAQGPETRMPLQLAAGEARYIATVEQLERELDEQRKVLRPETVAMVERSLRTIDTAIAEARAALLADPANDALEDVLESGYRQKVDFLKRATQIASGN